MLSHRCTASFIDIKNVIDVLSSCHEKELRISAIPLTHESVQLEFDIHY